MRPRASLFTSDLQSPHLKNGGGKRDLLTGGGRGHAQKAPAAGLPRRSPSSPPPVLPPTLRTPVPLRMAGFDGSAWDEEEEEPPDHQYYNDFPGKEPPLGGVVDMRLREGALPGAARPAAPSAQPPSLLGATLVSCLERGGLGPAAADGLWSHLTFVPSACGTACWGRPRSPQADATSATLPRYGGAERHRGGGAGGRAKSLESFPFPSRQGAVR